MAIVLRQESDARATTKGTSLNFQELDNNFIDLLNRATLKVEDDSNTQVTVGNDGTVTAELKVVGAGGLTTSVTSDSTGQAVLTLTQAAAAGGGLSAVTAGTNIAVANPDSAGAVEVSLAGQVDNAVFNFPTFKGYQETIYTSGTTTGTITPDVQNGNVQAITLTGSITLNAFNNPVSGQSLSLIVKQPSSGGPYTLTSSMKFAGGTKTLSTTADAIDVISIVYDGTDYFASLSTNFS